MPGYRINRDLKRIELYLEYEQGESVRGMVKAQGFKWNRNEKSWHAEEKEDRLSLVRKLCPVRTKKSF